MGSRRILGQRAQSPPLASRRCVAHRWDLGRSISTLATFSGLLTVLVAGFPVDVMAQGSETAERAVALGSGAELVRSC